MAAPSHEKTLLDCPCGHRIVAETQDGLLRQAREHLQDRHPDLQYSDEQILFVAY